MYEWQQLIQRTVDQIDASLRAHDDEAVALRRLSETLGYSEYYMTRKFREISGMRLRDYLRRRRLAFALKEVRDSSRPLLDIALDYGFSSHEAFTRAFEQIYGMTPSDYRRYLRPVILRTKINPFDRYLFGLGEIGMVKSSENVKTYFVTIPAHKFLHIENRESNGYWDFWQKQSQIPGQDHETVCGLLDSIPNKLDDAGATKATAPPVRSWRILMTPPAACATGAFCERSAMVSVSRRITPVRRRHRCFSRTSRRESMWFLSTAPLTMNRNAAPWRRK